MVSTTRGGLLLSLALGATACSSGTKDPTPPKDEVLSGPQIKYTPAGCDYLVTSPSVNEGLVNGDQLAVEPPDNVHVGIAGDAATTFAVNWRSEQDATASELLYGTNADAVASADGAGNGVQLQKGHALLYRGLLDVDSTRIHEVHVCGLQPATKYFYKVGNKGAWSKVFSVTTAPTTGSSSPLTIAVTGDARTNPSIWAQVQQKVAAEGINLQIFSGDAVDLGVNQVSWNDFFQKTVDGVAAYEHLASAPFMPANGNHEDLGINYVAQFALPQEISGRENGVGKEWYSFDYGNVHVISLNDTSTTEKLLEEDETNWLKADLAKVDRTKTPWIFVNHHRPLYSCSKTHGSEEDVRALWQPLYDEYKVDIVFNGHVHDYERTKPIRGLDSSGNGIIVEGDANGAPVNGNGTVYVVSGGAGAPLYEEFKEDVCTAIGVHTYEATRNYVILKINGKTLEYKAYRLDGSPLDSFTLTKN
jgi:hypothetical protein